MTHTTRLTDALERLERAAVNRSGRARAYARRLADELDDAGYANQARDMRNATRWGLDNLAACARNVASVIGRES